MSGRGSESGRGGSISVWLIRLAIVVGVLAAWQYLPQVGWLREKSPVFDPFFVSSPEKIFNRLIELFTGGDTGLTLWPYLLDTLKGTLLGVVIGTVLGAAVGLLFANSPRTQRVMNPFMTLLNATPRIALVPIFVIIAGPTLTATVVTAVCVVFFLVFYNAYAGGASVPGHVVHNARLLGASGGEVMRTVRLPYVLVWTFASLPNAISFGLVAVVTAEILTGQVGMGRLLLNSISSVDSTLTFAVVVVLAIVGVILVTATEFASKRALHWWEAS
jgi:NitT/TauT family transport system permease protein